MPLTPEDVSSKRFTPVRLREGYDMGEVDQFLDEVEAELVRLGTEIEELRAARTASEVVRGDDGTTTVGVETLKVETLPQASSAAARLLEIAARNAEELVAEATEKAEQLLGAARSEAEQLGTRARAEADEVEAEARRRSEQLDQETGERRTQLFADLERERDRLSGEVDTLRSFEREYRSRLRAYFSQQLQSLDQQESSRSEEPSEPLHAAPGEEKT